MLSADATNTNFIVFGGLIRLELKIALYLRFGQNSRSGWSFIMLAQWNNGPPSRIRYVADTLFPTESTSPWVLFGKQHIRVHLFNSLCFDPTADWIHYLLALEMRLLIVISRRQSWYILVTITLDILSIEMGQPF